MRRDIIGKARQGLVSFSFVRVHVCYRLKVLFWWIGDFWVAFRLCFKASPGAKPFMWISYFLFTRKFCFIYMWIKLISVFHERLGLALKQRRPIHDHAWMLATNAWTMDRDNHRVLRYFVAQKMFSLPEQHQNFSWTYAGQWHLGVCSLFR